ncbi:MAG: transposase [bacterium]|nr:transposase [bacterium]
MKQPQFANGEIYHIYNRGVEKRVTFLNQKDYMRFADNLFVFNDAIPVLNLGYDLENNDIDYGKTRKLLVEILAFCLMPNHFHLLLRQKVDEGITKFMRKLGTGYTNYFNKKYSRVGPLFQGIFKSVLIKRQAQLTYLPHYIHLNCLDITMPEWRSKNLRDKEKALNFLDSYRWSSYLDYTGKSNFPHILSKALYRSSTSIEYKIEIGKWLDDLNIGILAETTLE